MVQRLNPDAAIGAFFDQWHLYDLLIRHDYMSHSAIHRTLRKSLSTLRQAPFSVMDLGCGDASVVAQTLRGLSVTRYVGVDLSEIALEAAAKNFADARFRCDFVAGNLSWYLARTETEPVDVVIAGFAVHHLRDDQKTTFFSDCARKLQPGGDLYLFDVFCQHDQGRDDYLDSYCGQIERDWTELSAQQKRSICEHIREYDFPVSYETMHDLAQKAGFETKPEPDFVDPDGFHCLCRFRIKT